jgi:hypothetical protein
MVDLKGILALCGVLLGLVAGFELGAARGWLIGFGAALVGFFIGGISGFSVGMLLELFEEFVSRTSDKLGCKNRILAGLFRVVCALLIMAVVLGGLFWGVRTLAKTQLKITKPPNPARTRPETGPGFRV